MPTQRNGSSQQGRLRPRSVRIREQILEAAEAMLSEGGYGSLTIEGAALRSGVAKTTIYRYWPTKAALTAEVLRRRTDIGVMPDSGDARADLISFLSVNLRNYAAQDPAVLLPAFWDTLGDAAHRRELRDQVLDRRRNMGRALLARLIDGGALPAATDIDLLLDMWAGFALYRFGLREKRVTLAAITALVDLVLAGTVPLKTVPLKPARRPGQDGDPATPAGGPDD
ncbi:MAG TPA: TetR/AcrR family transcriptional regulator [Streptosporangiaceae bacterium]|jgi:AcrR family transcriptional regulator